MPRISGFVTLALLGALTTGPAMAAPAYAGTNDAPGAAGDRAVDCSDQANRFMPFCQLGTGPTTKLAPTTLSRTNTLSCPATDLVLAGRDRNGNRLYRCAATSSGPTTHSPAATFSPGY